MVKKYLKLVLYFTLFYSIKINFNKKQFISHNQNFHNYAFDL